MCKFQLKNACVIFGFVTCKKQINAISRIYVFLRKERYGYNLTLTLLTLTYLLL